MTFLLKLTGFLVLPFCQAATVSIERSVVSSNLLKYDTEEPCGYVGEITLGHPMSVGRTDRYYTLGSQMLESAHISLDAVNLWPRCGVHLKDGNYSLRLITYGDESDANMTEIIGNALAQQNNGTTQSNQPVIDFMLAGYSSTLTAYLAPIAQENQRLLLTAGSSGTEVHAERDHVFGLIPPSGTFLENAFKGLARTTAKTVAFVTEEDVGSCLEAPELAEQYNMTFLNGTILPEYAPHETYLQVATLFAELNPDVVFVCIRTEFATWNQVQREIGWSPPAEVYTIVVGTPEFEEAMGPDLAYKFGVSSWDRALPPIPDGATGWTPYDFDVAFEQASFRRAAYQHASQSAALSVLVQAMERVGDYHNTSAIRDEIATGFFSTVYGNVSFDVNGQSTAPNLLMQYDLNGSLHVLLPTSLVSTDFELVYPSPSFGYRDCEFGSLCGETNGTCAEDGTCDCQYFEAVSEGQGRTAQCVIRPPAPAEQKYLALAIAFPLVALVVIGAATFVYNKKVKSKHDDSVWQIFKKDLIFSDPPEIIGQGSFGVVLLAEYRGTHVAVKRALPSNELNKKSSGLTTSGLSMDRTSLGAYEAPTEEVLINDPQSQDKASASMKNSIGFKSASPKDSGFAMGTNGFAAKTSKASATQLQLRNDFIQEMRCLNQLRHPTIITILGAVVEPTEEPMLIMEYMDHGSLYSMLHNETMNLDDDILLPILRDISSGCRYLHSADPQVIHGDLKSANILVDDKFRAKVADFGLAGIRSKEGATGTPFWMAPELLRRESLNTAASDIYSFGIILNEVFSRKDPYEGEENPHKILKQVADPRINKRPAIPKDCPAQLASLMADCLVANPDERPSFQEIDIRLKRVEARTDNKPKTMSLFDIFPKKIAEALRDGKKVEPEHKDCVTIFFSDIRNFTSISSDLDPRKVAGMLDRLYSKFDKLSVKHDIFKVETIGDAYMAVTNLVKDQHADHASRIARFAIDAIKEAKETLIDPEDPDKGYLSIRCGFHSGSVVADVVGSMNPRYCLFGDTVNTASRMESNSAENRILCSKESADLLKDENRDISMVRRGKINVKGKGDMVVYWVGDEEINSPPSTSAIPPPPESAKPLLVEQ